MEPFFSLGKGQICNVNGLVCSLAQNVQLLKPKGETFFCTSGLLAAATHKELDVWIFTHLGEAGHAA